MLLDSPQNTQPCKSTATKHKSSFPAAFALAFIAVLGVCAYSSNAQAQDFWSNPNPGVRHLRRVTPAPAEFNAIVVDLNTPGVSIRCTPINERWRSTSAFARGASPPLAAAINGGFWGFLDQQAYGLAAGDGRVWSSDTDDLGFFAFNRNRNNAWISPPAAVSSGAGSGVTDGVSGRPLLVDSGRTARELWEFPRRFSREPRTVVGVSRDGHSVILATVDGRRSTSHGGTLVEMANLLIELGAYRGINLDGGGSTTMYIASEGGIVNRPSRGWEREVLNHIGVVAPAPAPAPTPAPTPGANPQAQNNPPNQAGQPQTPPGVEMRPLPENVRREAEEARAHSTGNWEEGEGTGIRGWVRAKIGTLLDIDRFGLGQRRELIARICVILTALILGTLTFLIVRRIVRKTKQKREAANASSTAQAS